MTNTTRNFPQTLGMAAIAALALAGSLTSARAAIMTMKQDLADREKDIHWPEGFNPSQADLFSQNDLRINASCERIWTHRRRDEVAAVAYFEKRALLTTRIYSDGSRIAGDGLRIWPI